MFEIFVKGGITMYPILLLSIISLAIFLERLFVLRRENYIPKEFEEKLVNSLKKKDIKEAKLLCENNKSSISNVSLSIISNTDLPLTRLLEVADEAGRREVVKLEKYQPLLQTIVAIAPLLGLLGTVFGMIKIFNVIAMQGAGQAQDLSAGIAEALITTAAGLIVAIPTQIFYHIVRNRADSIASELEKSASNIMNLIFKEDVE